MKASRPIVIAALIVACVATMYVFSTRPPAYREEIVEDSAIAMIDFSELHPDLSEFIDQLRANQVVGRNTSEFPKLWQHTITDVEDENPDDRIWYSFILPMTAEQEIENDQARKQTAGVPCWPMLGVRVDTKKSVIVMAGVYTQCLQQTFRSQLQGVTKGVRHRCL